MSSADTDILSEGDYDTDTDDGKWKKDILSCGKVVTQLQVKDNMYNLSNTTNTCFFLLRMDKTI